MLRFASILAVASLAACAAQSAEVAAPTNCPEAAQPKVAAPVDVDVAGAIRAVSTVLDDWHDAAAKADEARYFGHLDEASIFLGTDATERWSKAAFAAYSHPHFARGKAWTFRATRRDITIDTAELAHFDEDLDTVGLGPARGSGVLAKRDGSWKILQYNLAITVPNERFDTVKTVLAPDTALLAAPASQLPYARLEGSWLGVGPDGAAIEEHWSGDVAGMLVGMGRSTKDGKPVFFEHLRIEPDEKEPGGARLIATPRGGSSTAFRMLKDDAALVFENKTHDPSRISYQREGETLLVSVTDKKGKRTSWTLRRALLLPANAK